METGVKVWLNEEKVLKHKSTGSAAVLWCHWQWIMSSSLKVVGSGFKSMGMMLDAGCWGLVLKPFLLTSAMLSGSFQILLNESPLPSLHFRFMDSWFQKCIYLFIFAGLGLVFIYFCSFLYKFRMLNSMVKYYLHKKKDISLTYWLIKHD